MTHNPYILFHQTHEQLRRIGARGGRATARNRRARRGIALTGRRNIAAPVPPDAETAAQAIAALDLQFPWLRGAEKRFASALRSRRPRHGVEGAGEATSLLKPIKRRRTSS